VDLARPFGAITPTVDGDVLAVLAGADAAFTGRQVHRLVGRHSESGVRKALHRLVGQGTVTADRVGQADIYSLNRDHLAAPYVVGLADLRSELLSRMADDMRSWRVRPTFAALFGSAARGDMTEESDIDLFVVRPDPVDIDDGEWRAQLDGLSQRVHRWTGNDARVFELGEEEVRTGLEQRARVLRDVRADGLTLLGSRSYLASAGKEQAGSNG
jgi:predicted nucleotidyltransferase